MNALSLRCRYTFAPVTLFLIFVLGFVVSIPTSADAQRTTSTEPLWASHSLHLQFSGEPPRPLAMVTGDFDEDGVSDLVVGYALTKGGSIAVLHGNLDAHAPQTHESWLAAGQHEYSDPYLQNSEPISLDSRPSLMTAADVNGDGHLDLVFATKGGNQLFALFGDGKGNFLPPVSTTVDGGVTALAAYRPGTTRFMGEMVILGQQSNAGAKLSLLSYSSNTWTTQASYSLPGRATAMTVANLDADSIPDTAIVAGGQLLILHGKAALSGTNALTTVPGSDVESVTAGSFLFDRHGLLQLSVLTSSGDVVTLAHEGFDSRPYTTQELAQSRRFQRSRKKQQVPIQQASNPGDEPWIEVERRSGVAPHSSGDTAPILLRSRFSGSGTDDLVVLNSSQQQQTLIRQANSGASSPSASTLMGLSKAAVPSNSSVSSSSLASGNIIAAISAPVSPDTRQGLVMLSANSLSPEVSFATTGTTYYVNTTADNIGTSTDPRDGIRCTQGSAEICTLRDAISFANSDGPSNISGGKSDTIMLPAGTYVLSQRAGSFDANGNALTHLEILGPMSVLGASAASTIIDGGANDEVFTINGGPYSSAVLNPSGTSYVFDVALNNLTIQNGENVNSGGTNSVGGCINWDAFGNGDLTITSSVIQNCSSPFADGGGIWVTSTDHGNGTLTLNQDQFLNNSTQNLGGGLQIAPSSLPDSSEAAPNLSASTTTFSRNSASFGGGLSIEEPASTTAVTFTLTNVTVDNNQALSGGTGAGGEIGNDGSGTILAGLLIQASTFADNSASGGLGGGLHINSPGTTTTVTASNFQGNSAGTGGAIAVDNDFSGQSSTLQISLSRIVGNTATNGGGISGGDPASPSGSGAGKITATENWWGCNSGSGATGCDTTAQFHAGGGDTLTTSPYAVLTLSANPTSVSQGATVALTAGITTDNLGATISGAFPSVQSLTPTYSTTSTGDSITDVQPLSSAGISTATLNASGALGPYTASAKVDNATATASYTVASITTTLTITAPAITFGNTPAISVALTVPSSSPSPTGLTASNFTANIDGASNPLTISGLTAQNTFTLTGSALNSLNAGNHTINVNFSGVSGYSASLASATLTVNKAPATVTLNIPTVTYDGTAHAVTATTSPSGLAVSITYNGSATVPRTAGTYSITGTISDTNYTGNASGQLVINKAALDFAWAPTSPIVYGTALSAAQFNATATFNGNPVAGSFSYSSGIGTVLGAGTHALTVSFTPADTTDFSTPSPITANITVTQAAPVLAWSPASPIVYGTGLSSAQLNATATFNGNPVAGSFSYSSGLGTVLSAGTHSLTATFIPSDTTDYSTPAPIAANVMVTPATPGIAWSPSSPIVYGTALSAAQLNATATSNGSSVTGTFGYNPGLGTVLTAGTHTLTVTFTPSDTTDFNTPGPTTTNITVNPGAPVLAWSQPASIVSGTALSATQLNATASYNGTAVGGTFSYNPALGTVLTAGTHTLTAAFTPIDTTDFSTPAPITTNIIVQAVPVLAWSPTSPIVYGTALSSAQLNATASFNGNPVAGTFSYSSGVGTVLTVGTHTLTATFTPSDPTTFSTPMPITVNVVVTAATPVLQWAPPTSIIYGTALTGTQLNATASFNGNPVAGTFSYSSGVGTVLTVGTHTLTATFTPSDPTTYSTPMPITVNVVVTPATPVLQWAAPTSIIYGSALTGTQLNATATNLSNPVSGTFVYTPVLGTVLSAGSHTLTATFIPTDTTDYNTPTGTISTTIMVTPATPMLQWTTPAPITYGTALTSAQLNAMASYNGSPVAGAFTYTPALGTVLNAGSHTLTAIFTPTDTTDYSTPTGTINTTIMVNPATPALQWATPAPIAYGTALTSAQLNAVASYNGSPVTGAFTYTPALGAVLSAGSHTLSVAFTPTDTATYGTPVPIQVNLIVTPDALTITANSATRVYGTANPSFTGTINGALPGDNFTESFATAAMVDSPVGSYPITPSVTGSNLANYAVTAQNGVLTVTPAGTTLTLSTTSATANASANVSITATVASATTGVPTGSVQFLDGSTVLGNGVLNAQGIGTYTTSSLTSGAHLITAVYAGDTNFAGSSSSPSTITIGSPGYALIANPASLTLKAGQTGKVSLTFTPEGGFTGTVSLSCAGLPAGASCNFTPSNLTADGSNKQQTAEITITTLGSNHGTVSMNRRDGSSSGPLRASMSLLPGMFFGAFLMWQRKKLRVRNGELLVLLMLVVSLTSMVGCGALQTTTLGSSSVLVTATASATGSGASNASAAFTLTIVE